MVESELAAVCRMEVTVCLKRRSLPFFQMSVMGISRQLISEPWLWTEYYSEPAAGNVPPLILDARFSMKTRCFDHLICAALMPV